MFSHADLIPFYDQLKSIADALQPEVRKKEDSDWQRVVRTAEQMYIAGTCHTPEGSLKYAQQFWDHVDAIDKISKEFSEEERRNKLTEVE